MTAPSITVSHKCCSEAWKGKGEEMGSCYHKILKDNAAKPTLSMVLITYSYSISYFLGGSLALCHTVTLKMLLTSEKCRAS